MRKAVIHYALGRIRAEWESLPSDGRPWGVWIRQYAAIPEGFTEGLDSHSALERVWFMTEDGISPRDSWDYLRMMVVQAEQPWCQKMSKERTIWLTTGRYEIGFAGFAEYSNGRDVYLEVVWGGLFGRGWRLAMEADNAAAEGKLLWLS